MAFRVKDLMISVIPKEGDGGGPACPGGTMVCDPHSPGGGNRCPMCGGGHDFCNAWSHHPTLYPCGCPIVVCPPNSHTAPNTWTCCPHHSRGPGVIPVAFAGDPQEAAEQLAALKSQLKAAIEEIEAQEKLVGERLQPQTVAEIEALQAKLKEAHAELDKKKADLRKR